MLHFLKMIILGAELMSNALSKLVSIIGFVCIMCKPILKCSLGSLARLGTYFIVELFIEDTQHLSLCCARYMIYLVEFTLNPNSMIEIAPEQIRP